jgi:hypothetical protein
MEVLQSLRQLLLNSDAHMSLSRKVRLARDLARSVSFVHALSFVHKNIRPESVLCFESTTPSSSSSPGPISSTGATLAGSDRECEPRSRTFLVGFDAFRAADGQTLYNGDMSWDRNVYRHPLRQGEFPADKYSMRHDIYSLGVVLLEIGLWESFVEYTDPDEVPGPPVTQFGKSYWHFQAWLKRKHGSDAAVVGRKLTFLDALAFRLKDYLVEQAQTRLPARMGDKYTSVVAACLTCLDEDSHEFGGEGAEDDMAVAVQFVERIVVFLDGISV